jgi:purine-nucleoside phosphorylase
MMEQINAAADFLRSNGVRHPDVGVIMGTGLGKEFVRQMRDKVEIHYADIPNFPLSTVESHSGKLVCGMVSDKIVLAMQGRFHYYEGYSMQQVTLPVRVMKVLGVKNLLISNAAGNLSKESRKGALMLLDDHINLLPENPLRGKNIDALGVRFPDMSEPYSKRLNQLPLRIAADQQIELKQGVYVCVPGPNLETRAEYRFLRLIGADAVGMSTVPEVIVAHHMALPCCAISVLTDDCDPENLKPVNIAEIIEAAERAEPQLTALFVELIRRL